MKFNFEEISVGDEVYFDSTQAQHNYDLYWTVLAKLENEKQLIVQLNEMGHTDTRWTIDIKEVRKHLPISRHKD